MRDRFKKDVDKLVREYTASVAFDMLLYNQDIDGSIAHARMLAKQGVMTNKESEDIVKALETIRE